MMFKVLVIQTVNTQSDERAECLVNDRLSFMRFLGLGLSDRVPDARTIWLFREKLTRAGAMQRLSIASMRCCAPPDTSPCRARLSMPAW
jgi:transposase, IS5 family